jgi:hypothetical protein
MIGVYCGVDIGEHSSANCPWEEAIEAMRVAIGNKATALEAHASAEFTHADPDLTLLLMTADLLGGRANMGVGIAWQQALEASRPVCDLLRKPQNCIGWKMGRTRRVNRYSRPATLSERREAV